MATDLKRLVRAVYALKETIQANTEQNGKLETEVRTTREVDQKNREFLEELCKTLITDQKEREKSVWQILGKVLDWVLRVGLILLGIAFTVKVVLPYVS